MITADFAAGKLSYSQVRAITRVATPDNEATLVMIARHSTASQLERSVRAYRKVLSADDETDAANAQHMARFLRMEWADDGSLEGHFRLTPEVGAVLTKAVELARTHVPDDPEGSAEHPREPAATNSDAVLLLAETFLRQAEPESGGGDRFQVVINVDDDVLTDDADGTCELDDELALASETVRRIACDASIVQAAGDAVDRAWKKTPAIPAATRRAVRRRDRGCRFPGCGRRAFTQIHHVRHRARGGSNDLGNLIELCWFHHRLVHEGGWCVRLDRDGEVLAIRPNGNVLPRPRPSSPTDRSAIERANRAHGVRVGPKTVVPCWYGDRLDLACVVDALSTARRRD